MVEVCSAVYMQLSVDKDMKEKLVRKMKKRSRLLQYLNFVGFDTLVKLINIKNNIYKYLAQIVEL